MSTANGTTNGANGTNGTSGHPGSKLQQAYKEDAETKSTDT